MAVRRRRDSEERGAALFLVVLVVTLLTAIGVFAAHATSMAQAASGYSRRSAMSSHLAEFSLNSVALDMANEPQKYDQGLKGGVGECSVNRGVDATLDQCMLVTAEDAKLFLEPGVATDATGALFGVLSRDNSVDAAFQVQVHQKVLGPQPTRGMGATGAVTTKTWETTVTATGRILPVSTLPDQCNTDLTRASENLSLRSIVTYTSTGG